MADLRLRLFAREPEDPASRARVFSESIRSGVGSRERLQLLADLGDPAAQIALGSEQRPPYLDYRVWVGTLQRDPAALAHLALAVLQHVRPAYSEHGAEAPCALIERVAALEGVADVDPELLDELSTTDVPGEPFGTGGLLRRILYHGLACASARLRGHPSSVCTSGESLLTTLASLLYDALPPADQERGVVAGEACARQLVIETLGEWILAGEPALPQRESVFDTSPSEHEVVIPPGAGWEPEVGLLSPVTPPDHLQRLERSAVFLAAALGYTPARNALGSAAPCPESLRADQRAFEEFRWVCEHVARNPQVATHVLRAHLRQALPLWEQRFPRRTVIRRAFDATAPGHTVSADALKAMSKACTVARRKAYDEGEGALVFVCELARTLIGCVHGRPQERELLFALLGAPRNLTINTPQRWVDAFRTLREHALGALLGSSDQEPDTEPQSSEPQPYSPRTTYRAGQKVVHPTFGAGEVLEVQGKKVKVRFGEASKLLAHGL